MGATADDLPIAELYKHFVLAYTPALAGRRWIWGCVVKRVKVQLVKSTIGRPASQRVAVRALGLRKMRHIVDVEDTDAVRGLIAKVAHLVLVVES